MRARGAHRNWLSLLRSCRQIYSETVFLPFQLSKFSFSNSISDGLDFLHVELLPGQVAALTHLTLGYSQEAKVTIKLPPLAGLKELTFILRDRFWNCEDHFTQAANVRRWIGEVESIPDDVELEFRIHWAWKCQHPRV